MAVSVIKVHFHIEEDYNYVSAAMFSNTSNCGKPYKYYVSALVFLKYSKLWQNLLFEPDLDSFYYFYTDVCKLDNR